MPVNKSQPVSLAHQGNEGDRTLPQAAFSPLAGLRTIQLGNGLKVFFQVDSRHPLVSVQAWVRVGSVDESNADAGLSHVLEHMVFKGTAHHQAADISRWVESLGGSLNAETSREYTHYYIDVPREGAHQAVKLMSELLYRAALRPEEWQRECLVILEEIKRRNDDPEAVLWDLLNQALFKEIVLQRPVIGFPRTVRNVTRERLHRFYKDHYTAGQTVLVITGDVDERRLETWVRGAFDKMPAGKRERARTPGTTPPAVRHRLMHQAVQQSYVAIGFRTPPGIDPDHEALDVLAAVLGEGRGSRLVHTLRESKKLVWSISAANLTHEGPGVFGIFADCEAARRVEVTRAIRTLLRNLKVSPATPAEILRAKKLLETSWFQGFETIHGRAGLIGSFALENHLERLEAYLPRLLSVTSRQLQEVANRYLGERSWSSAVIEAA